MEYCKVCWDSGTPNIPQGDNYLERQTYPKSPFYVQEKGEQS